MTGFISRSRYAAFRRLQATCRCSGLQPSNPQSSTRYQISILRTAPTGIILHRHLAIFLISSCAQSVSASSSSLNPSSPPLAKSQLSQSSLPMTSAGDWLHPSTIAETEQGLHRALAFSQPGGPRSTSEYHSVSRRGRRASLRTPLFSMAHCQCTHMTCWRISGREVCDYCLKTGLLDVPSTYA